ncbi:MAG: D-2-hydroxyacid dehydrogenase, partial [Bacteroidaceae bacterium]|nr:D-2-hydroxyacid dehydrogenase [Bacteroidaceae bacterium]
MKIVVLDGFTANPGDVSLQEWQELGDLTVYDRSLPSEVVPRAMEAEIVLTNKVVLSRSVIEALPHLRYIGVLATGYNVVDVQAATQRGIVVTNIPAYSTMSVAQLVMAHLLHVTNRVADYASEVRRGDWQRSEDFCFLSHPLLELDGKTLCIVGMGHIGRSVARAAQGFGMRVVAYSSKTADELATMGVEKADDLPTLFRRADVLSLHCPLTASTERIINAQSLRQMKPTAILINTGRGPLIDEQALADALQRGELHAACLDVLCQEPPVSGSPLIGAPRCYVTP